MASVLLVNKDMLYQLINYANSKTSTAVSITLQDQPVSVVTKATMLISREDVSIQTSIAATLMIRAYASTVIDCTSSTTMENANSETLNAWSTQMVSAPTADLTISPKMVTAWLTWQAAKNKSHMMCVWSVTMAMN